MWTLESALPLLRGLEESLKPHGIHVALGGSVLHRGESKKDLDVFLYPNQWPKAPSLDRVDELLNIFGFVVRRAHGHTPAADKVVWAYTHEGRSVDVFMFFPEAFVIRAEEAAA